MTIEELKQKHFKAYWNTSGETVEKHRGISIEFAIECLKEVVKEYRIGNLQALTGGKFKTVDDIVLDKIKNLKQD